MVESKIRLDVNRVMTVRGEVVDKRIIFGREEYLVSIKEIDPIWITKEKTKELESVKG